MKPEDVDLSMMDAALELARQALVEDQLPVGCIITAGRNILGLGRRSASTHFRLDHAEMMALREALPADQAKSFSTAAVTVYTTLEPCIMCYGAILHARLPRIVFALEDPYGGATSVSLGNIPRHLMTPLPTVVGGVRRTEARRLFAQYFRSTKNPFWVSHPDNPLCLLCR